MDSDWSDPITVKVDTTAPTAPTISCTSLSDGTWYDTAPAASSTCTVTASGDTNGLDATFNGAAATFPDLSGGSTSKSFTIPANGVFELSATAKDDAGNASTTSFKTGMGNGAMVSPNDQDRSTDSFTVAGKSKGDAYSAMLQWRLAGDSSGTWTQATSVTAGAMTWTGLTTNSGNTASTGNLTWNASTETGMTSPSVVETRFCFNYTASPTQRCTSSKTLSLVPHAIGGSFPTSAIGPGQVALMTGEYQMDATDVDVPGYGEDLTVGRSYQSLTASSSLSTGVFGPGWVADLQGPDAGFSSATVKDTTSTNATITLIDSDGSSYTYLNSTNTKGAQTVGTYVGQGETALDNDKLTITSSSGTKYLTLLEDDGTQTVWKHIGSGVWSLDHVTEPSSNSTTSYTLDSDGLVTGIYAPAPTGVTCNATTQAKGCRALQFTYTTIGSAKRLSQIDLTIWDPKPGADGKPTSSAAMTTTAVQKYSYDTDGKLTGAWDPRLGDGASALKTTYTYQTVGTTHTMLSTITPPGEKPWQLNFDASAELTSVTRAQDAAVGGSDATWTVDYDIAMSGTGLPNLEASTVATWGQPQAPTEATAVFGPDAPGTSDMTYADISYFTKEGRTTNTASYGAGAWQVDSTGYDSVGNVVWQLNEGNRNRALAAGGDTAAAANLLTTKAVYNSAGTRVEAQWEPARTVVLANGAVMSGRPKTYNVYDDEADASLVPGRPTPDASAPPQNLLVEQRDFLVSTDESFGFDRQRIRYRYDKVVSTDGDGWKLGMPTRTLTEISADTWSTELTRFDTDGKTIETRTPQGVSTMDGAGSDAKSTITTYYTADASASVAACQGHPEWAGEVCQVAPAAATSSIPVETTTGYDYLLNATRTEEASSPMTRNTVTMYDTAGRQTALTHTMDGDVSGDQAVPATTYAYSATTGDLKSTTAGGNTIATTEDSWGRTLTESDGEGNTAATTYDSAGRTKTVNDGKGTYTYTYDGTDAAGNTERRGLVTKLDVGLSSGPDEFSAAYDADGNNTTLVYPNGLTAKSVYDEGGEQTSLTYSMGSTKIAGFDQWFDPHGRVRVAGLARVEVRIHLRLA